MKKTPKPKQETRPAAAKKRAPSPVQDVQPVQDDTAATATGAARSQPPANEQDPTLRRLGVTFETYAHIAALFMAIDKSSMGAARDSLSLLTACRQELDERKRLQMFDHVSDKYGWGENLTFDQLAKFITGEDRANRAREYFERIIADWKTTPDERTRLLKMVKEGKTREYILRFRDDTIVKKVLDLIKETEIAREGASDAKNAARETGQ